MNHPVASQTSESGKDKSCQKNIPATCFPIKRHSAQSQLRRHLARIFTRPESSIGYFDIDHNYLIYSYL